MQHDLRLSPAYCILWTAILVFSHYSIASKIGTCCLGASSGQDFDIRKLQLFPVSMIQHVFSIKSAKSNITAIIVVRQMHGIVTCVIFWIKNRLLCSLFWLALLLLIRNSLHGSCSGFIAINPKLLARLQIFKITKHICVTVLVILSCCCIPCMAFLPITCTAYLLAYHSKVKWLQAASCKIMWHFEVSFLIWMARP